MLNSCEDKFGPELDAKVSNFELINQIGHAYINDLCDKFSRPTTSKLTKKRCLVI